MTGTHANLDCAELRARYRADGFVSIDGFLDSREVAGMRSHLDRVVRDVVPGMPADEVYCDHAGDLGTLKQLQRLHVHDQWMHRCLHEGPFARLAAMLLEDLPAAQNLQFFDKAPGTNCATPPHQDGAYFPITPMNAVTVWLALDDVAPEQGCVRYVRGSHSDGLRPHVRRGTLGFSREIADYGVAEAAREAAFPCKAGHVIAHSALTVHRADGNASATCHRRALGFIYYGSACEIDSTSHAEYQRRLALELREAGLLEGRCAR